MGYKDFMLELFGENLVFLEGNLIISRPCTLRPGYRGNKAQTLNYSSLVL